MLFSNICLMEKCKKNNIGQYDANFALYHISLSSWEGARRKMFSLWSAQDGWKHHIKHQMQVMLKFWKLALSMSSMKYVEDKLNNSFTVSGHFVLADKLSLTGRQVCLPAHPHESKIWNKANVQYSSCMFESLLNYSIHLMWENNTKFFKTNLEYWWFLFSIDSKNFFLTYVHVKMLT